MIVDEHVMMLKIIKLPQPQNLNNEKKNMYAYKLVQTPFF